MALVDTELQEFEQLLEYLEQAELDLMVSKTAMYERARKGEEAMRKYYEKEEGWTVYVPPTKKLTEPGPDAIIWRRKPPEAPLELRIVDNKSGGKGAPACPSGLSTRSLKLNLPDIIKGLRKRPGTPAEVVRLLEQTLEAVLMKGEAAKPLPPRVTLWVTNACGKRFWGKQAPLLFWPRQPERPVPVVWLDDIRDKVEKSDCPPST